MTRIQWDDVDPSYEIGIDKGVIYPNKTSKVSWNGLISVKETPSNEGDNVVYFEGVKILNHPQLGEFHGSVTAFTYPDEIDEIQDIYAMSFRTMKENNRTSIHVIYNPTFKPNDIEFQSFGGGIDPIKFSWDISNKPTNLSRFAPSGHFIIEFDNIPDDIQDIEEFLYDDELELPSPEELVYLFEELKLATMLLILDHGDGTWTAVGSDEMVKYLDETSFEITSPSAIYLDSDTYTISSI